MTISPLVIGYVDENGTFSAKDKEKFRAAFDCHRGYEVEFSPKRHKKNRSLNQNRFYWGAVIPLIGDAMGESDPEAIHGMLKNELNYYMATVAGRDIRVPMSTADLNTADFEAYLERIRRWALEFFTLDIPLPNEVAV